MGYQITWRKKDLPELDSKFKPIWSDEKKLDETVAEAKLQLALTCMNLSKESPLDIKKLGFQLRMMKSLFEEQWKVNLKNRLEDKEEEELWFCGWEYSKDDDNPDYSDVIFENIYTYTFCTKPADPLDDTDYFFSKMEKIQQEIEELDEGAWNWMTHEFCDMYRDNQIKDDEDSSTDE